MILYLIPISEFWIPHELIYFSLNDNKRAYDIGDIYTAYGSPKTNELIMNYQWTDEIKKFPIENDKDKDKESNKDNKSIEKNNLIQNNNFQNKKINKNNNNENLRKNIFDEENNMKIFKENNGKKKDREIPYYYQKYFDILCDNGLENVFFFTEKASLLKIIITLTIGIASMGLAIGLGIRTKMHFHIYLKF